MNQRARLMTICFICAVLVLSGCKFGKADHIPVPIDGASLETVEHELLGEHLHSNMRAFEIIDGSLHMLLTTDVTPATGTGRGLQYWTKPLDSPTWEKHEFLPDRIIGMANIVSDPLYTDDLFFIFNDRTWEDWRYAVMARFDGSSLHTVFELDQSEGQVLNPKLSAAGTGISISLSLTALLPARTASNGGG